MFGSQWREAECRTGSDGAVLVMSLYHGAPSFLRSKIHARPVVLSRDQPRGVHRAEWWTGKRHRSCCLSSTMRGPSCQSCRAVRQQLLQPRFGITGFPCMVADWRWAHAGTWLCSPSLSWLLRLSPVHRGDAASRKPSTVRPPPECRNRVPDSDVQHSLQNFAGDAAQHCTRQWWTRAVYRRQGSLLFCYMKIHTLY